MIKQLLSVFRTPSAKVIAQRELEDAQREYLAALGTTDYAKHMAEYYADRIKMLKAYVEVSNP